jgi:hypothetical protein
MSALFLVALGVYMTGHGVRGLPGGGLAGSIAMIVAGILLALSALI